MNESLNERYDFLTDDMSVAHYHAWAWVMLCHRRSGAVRIRRVRFIGIDLAEIVRRWNNDNWVCHPLSEEFKSCDALDAENA